VGAQKDTHQSVFYFTTRVPTGGMLFESCGGTKRHSSECFLFYDPRPHRGDVIRILWGHKKTLIRVFFILRPASPQGGMLFESCGGTKRHSSECFLFYDPRPRRGDVIRIPVGAQKDIHQSVFYFTTRVPAGGMLFESPWGHKR